MNKGVNKYYKELIGLNTLVLFSKDIFKNNSDIKPFIKSVYGLEFRDYLYKSRTLLVARVNKHIYQSVPEKEIPIKLKLIKNFYSQENTDQEKNKRNRSKSEDNLSKWLDRI
ncbi:hypothetical protein [Alkalibacillus haloalkaliphilus]|uniref:hypothetical protein n=1 Tax=Alkalibacillus haloalkaliphilus TaxID=94136 RepID=UPI002936A6C6|nr:hypothetical protein [Alkalibacillus haloalkaliphilus]MDV2581406.1 hypothetical protein [Alkalibacillus haloalkaliphilus]